MSGARQDCSLQIIDHRAWDKNVVAAMLTLMILVMMRMMMTMILMKIIIITITIIIFILWGHCGNSAQSIARNNLF